MCPRGHRHIIRLSPQAAFRVVPSLHEALAPVAREHPALLKRYQANVPPQVFDRLLHMARDRGSAAPLELLHLLSYRHAALATHVVTHDLPPLVALLEPRATRGERVTPQGRGGTTPSVMHVLVRAPTSHRGQPPALRRE